MYFGDTGFWILVLPAMAFALWAQSRVKGTFRRWSTVPSQGRKRGHEVARDILERAGLGDVKVERIPGNLSDHYDPRVRVLRLSETVYESQSIAAIGVAAHEAGHAIQHDNGYVPLAVRNSILPVARFGSTLAWPLFIIGLIFSWGPLMDAGIVLFAAAVAFQAVTLPVEFNASSRAVALLEEGGYLGPQELGPARQVLNAAALTYVAATAVAVAQLLRLLLLRGRRD